MAQTLTTSQSLKALTLSGRRKIGFCHALRRLDLAKNCPRKQTIPVLENAAMTEQPDGQIGFVTTDLETAKPVVVREPSGMFPKYEACFPNDKPSLTIVFDASLMAEVCSFIAKAGDPRTHYVKMEFYSAEKPVKMTADNPDTGQIITALLMPMRVK